MQAREEILRDVRITLEAMPLDEFVRAPQYGRIRRELSEGLVKCIEAGRAVTVPPRGWESDDWLKQSVFREIADIEIKWKLR
jgi:hypothetical protein